MKSELFDRLSDTFNALFPSRRSDAIFKAAYLEKMLHIAIYSSIFFAIAVPFLFPNQPWLIGITLLIALVFYGLLQMQKKKQFIQVSWALTTFILTVAIFANYLFSDMRGLSFIGYFVAITAAGVLLGGWAALSYAGLSILSSGILLALYLQDKLPPPLHRFTTVENYIGLSVFLAFFAIIVMFTVRSYASIRHYIRKSQYAQKISEAQFEGLVSSAPDAIIIVDDQGIIQFVNTHVHTIFQYLPDELTGKQIEILVPWRFKETHIGHRDARVNTLRIRPMGATRKAFYALRKDGSEFSADISLSPLPHADGTMLTVAIIRDITEQIAFEQERQEFQERLELTVDERTAELQDANQQLNHLASHDPLTDLPNRRMFFSYLDNRLIAAQEEKQAVIVLFIDIDSFKTINDTFGHNTGDQVLKSIATRLAENIREHDLVSRLSGDEFAVLLDNFHSREIYSQRIQAIMDTLSQPIKVDKAEFNITVSLGAAIYPKNGKTAEELINSADTAMYHAKTSGKNKYHIFWED